MCVYPVYFETGYVPLCPVSYTHLDVYTRQVKKMYMLPVSVPAMYLSKFLILTVMFLVAIMLQNLAPVSYTHLDVYKRQAEENAVYYVQNNNF